MLRDNTMYANYNTHVKSMISLLKLCINIMLYLYLLVVECD